VSSTNTVDFYNKNAEGYNLLIHQGFYGRIAEELLRVISKNFAPNSILEIGAGTGFATAKLKERYPQAKITCIEPSPAMLSKAKEKFSTITWQEKSLYDFTFGEHFDLIFCSMAAHWLTEQEWQILFNVPVNCLALALPTSSDNTKNNPANMLLKKLVFKLKAKPNWPKESRHLDYPEIRQVKVYNLSFEEEFATPKELAESLYTRGVLMALFDNKAKEAKQQLERDLNSNYFSWHFKLITASTPFNQAN